MTPASLGPRDLARPDARRARAPEPVAPRRVGGRRMKASTISRRRSIAGWTAATATAI